MKSQREEGAQKYQNFAIQKQSLPMTYHLGPYHMVFFVMWGLIGDHMNGCRLKGMSRMSPLGIITSPDRLNRGRLLFISVMLLTIVAPVWAKDALPTQDRFASYVGLMETLEPLQKVHYSWPVPVLSLSDDVLYQYARLTHAVSIPGEGYVVDDKDLTVEAVGTAVRACAAVNKAKPKQLCSIGLTYSVWHRHFGKSLTPTKKGPTHERELDELKSRLGKIKAILDKHNRRYDQPVTVSAILFDSERFVVRDRDDRWNSAITNKHEEAFKAAKLIYPDARIEWYARGSVVPGSSPSGWSESKYLTLQEPGATFSLPLYRVPEIETTRESFRRTVVNARKHGVNEVTPWIALGTGYRRQVDKFHAWSFSWNYDLIYSWQLGLELNQPWFGREEQAERFAPWALAKIAVFYPEPFGRAKHWPDHFIAYVRGANQVKDLSGIGEAKNN